MKRLQLLCFHLALCTTASLAQPAISTLEQVERDFAKYCGEAGIAAAWMKYFAADGTMFAPHPKKALEVYGNREDTQSPAPFTLYWEPYHGAVSRAADLGFNTGPWRIKPNNTDTVPLQYGYFFSVWKKDDGGKWKVLLDLGASVPTPGAEHVFGAVYDERDKEAGGGKSKAGSLEEAEYLFNGTAASGLKAAYQKMASGNLLSTISGFHPFYNKRSLLAWISSPASPYQQTAIVFSTADTGLAASGELGYSYGSYEVKGGKGEKGYYVRVWKKSADQKWYLIAEVVADNVKPRAAG